MPFKKLKWSLLEVVKVGNEYELAKINKEIQEIKDKLDVRK